MKRARRAKQVSRDNKFNAVAEERADQSSALRDVAEDLTLRLLKRRCSQTRISIPHTERAVERR